MIRPGKRVLRVDRQIRYACIVVANAVAFSVTLFSAVQLKRNNV